MMAGIKPTIARPHSPLRRVWPVLALMWLLLLTPVLVVACRPAVDVHSLQITVNLGRAHLAQVNRTMGRVDVLVRDAAGTGVPGLKVSAAVQDAAGRPVAELPCEPEANAPGRYVSRPFALGAASLGSWQIDLAVRHGVKSATTVWVFQVDADSMATTAPMEPAQDGAARPDVGSAKVSSQPMDTRRNALLFGLLISVAIVVGFVGLWRMWRVEDPLADRMKEYGMDGSSAFAAEETKPNGLKRLPAWKRLANGLGLGPRLAERLAQADMPYTASEYSLLTLGLMALGLMVGIWRLGALFGVVLGGVLGYLPIIYLNTKISRRRHVFEQQLPDVLMMLVGGLRAGYGLNQALQVVVDQLPAPASLEFGRVVNAVSLGLPITQALDDMTARVRSDDLGLIVTAISVQHQVGGNLAETLDTIGETIRDRIRIQGEIRALTAEEQLSGYVLGALPAALALFLFVVSPEYMRPLLEPGWQRFLPVVALGLQLMGLYTIRKMLVIEV